MIELSILGEVRREQNCYLGFWRADLELFSTLVGRVRAKGSRKAGHFLKKEISKEQEQAVHMCC